MTAFSTYTYIKMSNAYPSAGGIGMILKKAYGPTTIATKIRIIRIGPITIPNPPH